MVTELPVTIGEIGHGASPGQGKEQNILMISGRYAQITQAP
jgi:hypothetical protein